MIYSILIASLHQSYKWKKNCWMSDNYRKKIYMRYSIPIRGRATIQNSTVKSASRGEKTTRTIDLIKKSNFLHRNQKFSLCNRDILFVISKK